ncbi:MAG: FecR domain-containing protein [Aquitalea sp.]|nr:FecR domain-containing protein [Aquitalea sp.]
MRLIPALCLSFASYAAVAASGNDSATWSYEVKQGDSLWSFADQHLSSPAYVPRLQNLNHIADPYHLIPGSHIKVPYPWVRQHPSTSQIEEFSGEVSAHDAHGKPLPINKEMQYPKGVQFQTGNDAMLRLRFADGSTLQLNANSSAQLQNEIYYPSTGSAKTEIKLDKGNAGSSVIPNILMPNRYQIRTPSAVTTVRGTEFRVNAETADSTATEVLRGKVNVSGKKNAQVDVPAGFGSLSTLGSKPTTPEALPAPPDLSALPARSDFNPPVLSWQADPQARAYRAGLRGPGLDGQQQLHRVLGQPLLMPSLPANGEYQLSVRVRNLHGLEGYDSKRSFVLHAFPTPPLLQSVSGVQETRSATLALKLAASPEHPLLLQLSRNSDFASISLNQKLVQDNNTLPLPDKGTWFWRVARLDDKGEAGPYSDPQQLLVKGLFASISTAQPALLARRYPVNGARYTLKLADSPAMQHISYHDTRSQPDWPLQQLPRGHYFAQVEVSGDDGYHAVEAREEITID